MTTAEKMYKDWEKSGCNVGFGVYCYQMGKEDEKQDEIKFLEDILQTTKIEVLWKHPSGLIQERLQALKCEVKI